MEIVQFGEEIPEDLFQGVQNVHMAVFNGDKLNREKLKRNNLLALIALEDGVVSGFKFGYEQEDGVFYSWLGGVHPKFQRRGIAKALMSYQHSWCKKNGYKKVRTYGRNEKRAMLIFNLNSGFNIISTFIDKKGRHKIVFEKTIEE